MVNSQHAGSQRRAANWKQLPAGMQGTSVIWVSCKAPGSGKRWVKDGQEGLAQNSFTLGLGTGGRGMLWPGSHPGSNRWVGDVATVHTVLPFSSQPAAPCTWVCVIGCKARSSPPLLAGTMAVCIRAGQGDPPCTLPSLQLMADSGFALPEPPQPQGHPQCGHSIAYPQPSGLYSKAHVTPSPITITPGATAVH